MRLTIDLPLYLEVLRVMRDAPRTPRVLCSSWRAWKRGAVTVSWRNFRRLGKDHAAVLCQLSYAPECVR